MANLRASVVQGAICPPAMRRERWQAADYLFDKVLYKVTRVNCAPHDLCLSSSSSLSP